MTLAGALVPPQSGRVVLQHVVVSGQDAEQDQKIDDATLDRSTAVVRALIDTAAKLDLRAVSYAIDRSGYQIVRGKTIRRLSGLCYGMDFHPDRKTK